MVNLQPLNVAFATDLTKESPKSKFLKINSDFFINPDQVAMIVPGNKPNSSILLSSDTSKMVTITDSSPKEVVKVFDVLA